MPRKSKPHVCANVDSKIYNVYWPEVLDFSECIKLNPKCFRVFSWCDVKLQTLSTCFL